MPFHIRITPVGPSRLSGDELALDLTRDQLEGRFLALRRDGRPITIKGRTLSWDEIDRIRINETDEKSADLLPSIRAQQAASSVVTSIPAEWYVTTRGPDVTDEFITGPPGAGTLERRSTGTYFHVHVSRGLFRSATVFNLSHAEAQSDLRRHGRRAARFSSRGAYGARLNASSRSMRAPGSARSNTP
jgi:hypothetical protein